MEKVKFLVVLAMILGIQGQVPTAPTPGQPAPVSFFWEP
jgi:hypothetical protein